MKKILIGLVILIAIGIVASTIFVGKLDGIIADAIRTQGTQTLGSQVNVESVVTDLRQGSAVVTGLTIANPNGYQAEHALSIGNFVAQVDYRNQVVNQIVIDKPIINAEVLDTGKNNFLDLLNAMPDSEETTQSDDGEELIITINELRMDDAQVNVSNEQLGQESFVMDDFVVSNLSGSVSEISDILITQLTNHVSSQVTAFAQAKLIEVAKEKATEEIKEAVSERLNETLSEDIKGRLKGLNFELR